MSRKQKITILDVAALAGVSTATVSRAFDPVFAHKVSPKKRERVMAAAAELNYTINHVARSLKIKSTKTVAVIAPELANDFFMELIEAMDHIMDKAGYTLLVASSSNSVEEERKRLVLFEERIVDGIIVIPASSRGDHLQQLVLKGIPLLLVDRLVEGCSLDAVLSENEEGAAATPRTSSPKEGCR
jgi:LacI family transcriptional regulator